MGYRILNQKGELLAPRVFASIIKSVPDAGAYIHTAIRYGNTDWGKVSEFLVGFMLDSVAFHQKVGKKGKTNALIQLMDEYGELFGLLDELRDLELVIELQYKVVYESEHDGIKMCEVWASTDFEIRKRIPGNWKNIIAKEVIMD